jgi:hypothetical protein
MTDDKSNPGRQVPDDDPEQPFGRQLLTLIVAAGDHGMGLQELMAETGRGEEEIEDMLERLRAAGYLGRRQQRARH